MKYVLLFLGLAGMLLACGKEGPAGPKGPVGVSYSWPSSDITGYVYLYDEFGNPVSQNDSVRVQTNNGKYIFTTYSDAKGNWDLRKMQAGNYDVTFFKPGYDSLHLYVQHAGGLEPKFTGITTMYGTNSVRFGAFVVRAYQSAPRDVSLAFDVAYSGGTDSLHSRVQFTLGMYHLVNGVPVSLYAFFDPSDTAHVAGHLASHYGFASTVLSPGDSVYLVMKAYSNLPHFYFFNYATGQNVLYPYPPDSATAVAVWPALQ